MAKEKEKKKKRNAPAGNGNQEEIPKAEKRRKLASEISELKGLEIYWKLPSMDARERQAAVLALVNELEKAEREFHAKDEGKADNQNSAGKILLGEEHIEKSLSSCAPELQYALPRLVRGVGSSNQCARQGFASALTTIITKLPSVSTNSIVKLIDKEIEVSASLKGQELRDGLLGRLFAYASIIRAGRLNGEASTQEKQELVKLVAENLLNIALKRSFLREPAISVFLDFVDQLAVKTLQEFVFAMPSFVEWITATPEAGGADVLLLALKLWEKLPDSVRSECVLLPASGSFKDLFQRSQLSLIIPYLKESSSSHPRVHIIWNLLAQGFADLFSKPKQDAEHLLSTFWSRVVDETLLDSSHERKFLAMQLVLLFLPKMPPSGIPIILSASFGKCLLDILASPKNLLYTSAQQFISDLCSWAEKNESSLVFTIAFFQQTRFDHITKSVVVKDLMSKATSEETCLIAIEKLREAIISEASEDPDDESRKLVSSRRLWMIELMLSFCKQASSIAGSRAAMKEVARFLAAHLLRENEVVNAKKLSGLVETSPGSLQKSVKEACIARLRGLLSEKASNRAEENEDLGYDLVEFFRRALKKKTAGDLQLKLVDTIVEMTSAMKSVESTRMKAMRGLLSQLLIQLWLEPGSVDDIATDLLICCKKEFGSVLRISVGEDVSDSEGPSVPDVLLDIVLSILSGSPAPIRVAAEQLFGLYCGDISATGLTSMLKVISKQIGQTRQESLFDLPDDGEDVLSVEEVEDDEETGESGDEDEDDDEEEDQNPGKPNEKTPQETRIQGAMDDDAELSDMDDEAMFKLDGHLAQILKERKGGENTFTQLLEFKFRVLGLLETLLVKKPESTMALTIIPTLFQAYLDGNKLLADRISSVLNKALKAKSYPRGPEVDASIVKEMLLKLLKLASRAKDDRIRVLAQGFVLWIFKVSQATGGALSEEVLAGVSSGVDEVFTRSKSTLPMSFFQEGVVRFPWVGKVFIGKLLERCRNARTDYEKGEILEVLEGILKHYKKFSGKASGSSTSSLASFVEPHLPGLSEALVFYFEKPLKKHHQVSFLRFCVACVEALRGLFPGKALSKLVDVPGISAGVAGFQCPEKSKLQTFKAQLGALLKQSSDEEAAAHAASASSSKNKKRKK